LHHPEASDKSIKLKYLCFRANGEMKHDASDEDSEEENEEGDYTVYECPGLAPVSTPVTSTQSTTQVYATGG
jgi:hypothetical protein